MKRTKILLVFLLFSSLLCISITAETYLSSFDISAKSGDVEGVTTDGTYIWIVDIGDDRIYKYTMAGAYQSDIDISATSGDAAGIATDGTDLYIVDNGDDEVYRYNLAGAFQDNFDISAKSDGARGITTDGTYIWIVDVGDDEVYKYTNGGVYVSSFDTSSETDTPNGITVSGSYLWVVDSGDDEVYQYTTGGTYVDHFDISGKSGDSSGICTWIDSSSGSTFKRIFAVVDPTDDEVYKYYEYEDAYTSPTITLFSNKYEITWNNGNATDYVMVRKNASAYPNSRTAGSEVNNVTGVTEIITDWGQNEENYYSLWAWNSRFNVWTEQYNFTWSSFDYENISGEEYYQNMVTFEGYINSTGTAFVNYSDSLSRTNNTNITVYEINGSTNNISLFYYNTTEDISSFQRNFTVNTSNNYEVILHLNHSDFGEVYDSFFLIGSPRNITSPSRFDDIFKILGDNPFGWGGFAGFFVLIVGLFSFGARNAGVAIMLTGGVMVFINSIVGITAISGTIAILLIVMGALVQIKGGG